MLGRRENEEEEQEEEKKFVRQMDRANRIYIKDYSLFFLFLLSLSISIVLTDRRMRKARYDGISCIGCRCAQ
jgi:hypothetical protein